MNTAELIKKHETLIEILEAIKTFEMLKKSAKENIEGFCGTFPELRRKYHHKNDIYGRCIARLEERYLNLIKQIK